MNDSINTWFVVFFSAVSIVGTIGNLIVSSVYWKKRDKQTSTFFILVLALIDLTVCFTLVPMTIYIELILFQLDNLFICKAFYFLTTSIVPSSVLLMTSIAFDRYFCICMVNRKVMNLLRAKIIVIVLLIISILLGVVPSSYVSLIPISTNNKNETLNDSQSFTKFNHKNYQCQFDLNQTGFLQQFKYFYDLIYLLCVIVITVLYVLIYKEIYTRRKIKRNRKRELMLNSRLNGTPNFRSIDNDLKKESAKNRHIMNPLLNGLKTVKSPLLKTIEVNNQNDKIYNNNNNINDIEMRIEYEQISDEIKENNLHLKPIHKALFTDRKKSISGSIKSNFLRRHSLIYTKQMISKKDIRTAFMLFVISFLFISFYTPSIITTYISLLKPESLKSAFDTTLESKTPSSLNTHESDSGENLYLLYLYFSNSAINPIIYCFLNPNFRKDLIKLFFRRGFIYSKCTKVTNLN